MGAHGIPGKSTVPVVAHSSQVRTRPSQVHVSAGRVGPGCDTTAPGAAARPGYVPANSPAGRLHADALIEQTGRRMQCTPNYFETHD